MKFICKFSQFLKLFYLISIVSLASLPFTSCGDDEDMSGYLSQESVSFNSYGGSSTITAYNSARISVSSEKDWIHTSVSGNCITIIVDENPYIVSRTGYVKYVLYNKYGGSTSSSITVLQSGGSQDGGNTGGGDNPGGGNTGGGNNPGGGNTGGGNNPGGGNTGGNDNTGSSTQKPAAPTGVTVSNEGNNYIPDVRVRWNSVSNATNYYVYKSSSANGSYTKIGDSSYPQYGFSDPNPPTNGASAFYKVKAVNSAGESAFSDYAKYTSISNDEAFSPAYTYGNCTVSGSTMTLRWTNSTGSGYGKATEIVLRVWNPYSEEWQDTQLSANATSASFNFSTKINSSGFVKAGIVVSNAKGSFTAGAKVYDTKSKNWIN